MASWSKNSLSCLATWSTLRALGQYRNVFSTAGSKTMKTLQYWQPDDSAVVRGIKAKTLATQMHNIFTDIRGAELESGITKGKAIRSMVAVLNDATKTVSDLAEVNDASYLFWGEV